jgi:restriction system protein
LTFVEEVRVVNKRKQSVFEDIAELTAKVPWWIGVLLAIASYLILHNLAAVKVAGSMKPGEFVNSAGKQLLGTLAFFGQIILPPVFLIGAVISALNNRKREMLISKAAENPTAAGLNNMSWGEFEMLVGEFFRRKGYSVNETGGHGPDGGVDLELKKNNEMFLVQCKQWRAYTVSVNTVRELYGVMAARGAAGGFVVTSGRFTEDARSFAAGRNIELIDGKALDVMIKSVQSATTSKVFLSSQIDQPPLCPICKSLMIKRTSKRGATTGSQFWGCTKYPNCRGTLPL